MIITVFVYFSSCLSFFSVYHLKVLNNVHVQVMSAKPASTRKSLLKTFLTLSHSFVLSFLFFLHSVLPPSFYPSHCITSQRHRRRRRQPLWYQRSPVRADPCWAARRVPTPRPRLPRLRQRSRDKRLASACWLPKRPPRFGRTRPQRARTASKSTSLRPRLASKGTGRKERGCGF